MAKCECHSQMVMKNDGKFQWKIRLILIHGDFSTELPLFDWRCDGRIPHFLATDPCPSHWSWGTQNQNKCIWLVVWNMTGNIIYIFSIWDNISQWEGLSHIL